jgi:predicted acyltransferase
MTPSVPSSGLAIASLVLGICGLTILPLLASILAIIFGYMARRDIRQRPGEISGEGMAMAGIVMGWIAVGLAVAGLLLFGGITACGICSSLGSAGTY